VTQYPSDSALASAKAVKADKAASARNDDDPTDDGPRVAVTLDGYEAVRQGTEALCADLDPEDCLAQSMTETSPTKWHMAHTTWFFETFVLQPHAPNYKCFHPQFGFLFNSYYNGAGERHARPRRGLLTRPSHQSILEYRAYVNDHMMTLLRKASTSDAHELSRVIEIGLHHEQQHQELILTDIKHLFSQNPLLPAYRAPLPTRPGATSSADNLGWIEIPEGVHRIGHDDRGFSFDNERPEHRVFIEASRIGDRLVTNREYREFIADRGYERPDLWLDQGWSTVQREGWHAPLYWRGDAGGTSEFTLGGDRELVDHEPVSHVSFFEADAFARWAGARLPTEAEWEVTCGRRVVEGNFVESGRYHPEPANVVQLGNTIGSADTATVRREEDGRAEARQIFGDLWEWTRSSYDPYPGYRADAGTLGEYNGKFMCNQFVLRGGSCASARSHLRASYRNFFYAPDRWQFTGIRIAKE
jgi:ergothioneine biosynthesis protein EgtB